MTPCWGHLNVLKQAGITSENNKERHTGYKDEKQLLLVTDMGVTVPSGHVSYQTSGWGEFEYQISCEQMLKSMK